jgi:hypothetical protein
MIAHPDALAAECSPSGQRRYPPGQQRSEEKAQGAAGSSPKRRGHVGEARPQSAFFHHAVVGGRSTLGWVARYSRRRQRQGVTASGQLLWVAVIELIDWTLGGILPAPRFSRAGRARRLHERQLRKCSAARTHLVVSAAVARKHMTSFNFSSTIIVLHLCTFIGIKHG